MEAKVGASGMQREQLTSQESKQMTIGPAITTITFFRGDAAAASKALRARLAAVASANPWVCGTLEKSKPGLCLAFSQELSPESVDALFNPSVRGGKTPKKTLDDSLDAEMDFFSLCKAVGGTAAEVLKGSSCINNREPLMALTIAPSKKNTFAVIFSLSHVIADGFTYYKLLSMLSAKGDVTALRPVRKHDIVAQAERATGPKEFKWLNSGAVICKVLANMACGSKPVVESHYIDPARMLECKSAADTAGAGVQYVSSNDVLVSKFGIATQADAMLMPLNFRGRLPDFTSEDAGNYEGALYFGPKDCADPALVRKTLTSGPPHFARSEGGPLPGCCAAMCSMKMSMCVSWCFPFFQELEVDGCEHLLHLPHCDVSMVPFDISVIYRPRRGELAILCFVRGLDKEGIVKNLPVGDTVTVLNRAPAVAAAAAMER